VVTMPQLVHAFDSLIQEAEAQQAQDWGDADKCTYHEGYISQPIYACGTCNKNTNGETFGFCYGCSMSCHLHHEIYELFEKRNFRCDCATPKSVHACILNPKVEIVNNANQYNHNYEGLYCWCNQPYDHSSNVVMIQCYLCQDWFHDTCILKDYPYKIPEEPDNDFVCKDCMLKYQSFLGKYPQLEYIEQDNEDNENKTEEEKPTIPSEECLISTKKETCRSGNYFFRSGWRESLCRCAKCMKMYQLIGVSYLLKLEEEIPDKSAPDSTLVVTGQEKTTPVPVKADIIDTEMDNLTSQREIAYGIMEFRDKVMEFLKPFAVQKRTVTVADIEQFKEEIQKKQKKK